jgi:hypothetical protein
MNMNNLIDMMGYLKETAKNPIHLERRRRRV